MSSSSSSSAEPPSFYKRPLPTHLIPFSSAQGKQIFREALLDDTMNSFFPLMEQLNTQQEPSYCGLSTLSTVLNALGLDPNRRWKGPWRWYSEELLDCCVPLNIVREQGISMDEFQCLAQCNGVKCDLYRPIIIDENEKHENDVKNCEKCSENCKEEKMEDREGSIHHFRSLILKSMMTPSNENSASDVPGPFVVVSFDRSVLTQTGTGHFSAIGGYHRSRDLVLVLDSARFKYPCFWVDLKLLYESLKPVDSVTNMPRGYMLLSRIKKSCSSVLYPAFCQIYPKDSWVELIDNVRNVVNRLMSSEAQDLRSLVNLFVDELAANMSEIIQPFSSSISSMMMTDDAQLFPPPPSPIGKSCCHHNHQYHNHHGNGSGGSGNDGNGCGGSGGGTKQDQQQQVPPSPITSEQFRALHDLLCQIRKTDVYQIIRENSKVSNRGAGEESEQQQTMETPQKSCCRKAQALNGPITSNDIRAVLLTVLYFGMPMTMFRDSEVRVDTENARRIKKMYLASRADWSDCSSNSCNSQCLFEIENVRKQLEAVATLVAEQQNENQSSQTTTATTTTDNGDNNN